MPQQALEKAIGGKYEILGKIQEGGMGSIYKVRHRLLDEVRVIKVLRPQYALDEDLKTRFFNEARAAIRLRHPNIAHLYDFSVDSRGTAFIVLEFIDGVTLKEMLEASGPPELPLALEISRQCLQAISYLHRQGFVHRDISADNLMLTRDFDDSPLVKLIDLGIAKGEAASGLTSTGMFLGKASYSAPEQFSTEGGAAELTATSDIYSFGVLLYELLTGQRPVSGNTFSDVVAGHLFRPPLPFEESDPAARIPEGLRGVVLHALEKDPANRVQTADELAARMADFQQPVEASRDDFTRAMTETIQAVSSERPAARPGSTQGRIDRQFHLEDGTRGGAGEPAGAEESASGAEQAARRHWEVVGDARGVLEQIADGDLDLAEASLRAALAAHGAHPELEELGSRLEMLRSQAARGEGTVTAAAGETPVRRRAVPPRALLLAGVAAAALILGALGIFLWLSSSGSKGAIDASGGDGGEALAVHPTERWDPARRPPLSEPGAPGLGRGNLPPPPPIDGAAPPSGPPARPRPEVAPPPPRPEAREQLATDEPAPARTPPEPVPAGPLPRRGELFKPGPQVAPPEILTMPEPVYSRRGLDEEISIIIGVLVDEDGKVITARIDSGPAFKRKLKDAAMEAARAATFRPARKSGVAGKMWARVRVVFRPE